MIHPETGVVQQVTGVTHMFSEHPPAVEEVQSRPTENLLKTAEHRKKRRRGKRGRSK
jgi:hypothetical protein